MNSSLVAGVRDIALPVIAAGHTAAPQLVLCQVPSDGHAVMALFFIMIHCLLHLFLDFILRATRVHGKDVYDSGDLKMKLTPSISVPSYDTDDYRVTHQVVLQVMLTSKQKFSTQLTYEV